MWDMRRNITPVSVPARRCTVQFLYPELSSGRSKWWLVIDGREVDLCSVDPGFEVDLYVTSQLRSMTAVWMGHSTLKAEINFWQHRVDRGQSDDAFDPRVAGP